jgi:hypothetical protein
MFAATTDPTPQRRPRPGLPTSPATSPARIALARPIWQRQGSGGHAEGGSPSRPAPSGARRMKAAAPAASRPWVRLGSARPDQRMTAFGLDEVGVDRCREGGIVELHREIQRYTVFSFEVRFQAAPISVASVGRPPSISRACVLALRCAIRRAGGPRSRRLCLVERILPFRHAVGNDSRRR